MNNEKGILLEVKVIPGSKKQTIEILSPKSLKLKVVSKPEKGLANQEAIALLSRFLKIPKSKIKIIKGEKKRNKVFLIKGVSAIDEKSLDYRIQISKI
ncbi:DUF167 family protein [SCandidatus Aminicenantes bacterium Aminicenantia_JdfR_composite]|jgi:hypothetical protein|nr:DUF167 family protein [SCandidatus Aminicenantes bacterium Aminicenantia_JdfR_composite]MCP2605812.1 DUF167 family protein [Candidatus Aminicenantes bacterium AC-335-O07]MCP2606473.1 DUF167 family protein [Candidatus Aminicenantes bacterium AC-708-I09]